ncbi:MULTISPECIES: HAD-IA family hydrolase [unclassified Sphingomonas]|uniref:HAD-IA family hydrolase n=1 Tax=unclassified Sphingomonas TaxID=196159 RepID=UPI0006FF42AD|nr:MULTISPECIES: HAD-IA family hydrolase [unclassified Sphingomonas]KQM64107.1 phosphoglycolate phosphatase [Sphingomonas sp. Leaf16]KQN13817.1 phosphoglycolate phosphatase [Sphingomonas sp. Leaf29]KQN21403.1 phosphoglycolate phosphatase [Sphingomonas sp. Leaf32]
MTKISFDIVGFDLDGTFIDTSGDLTDAVNHALRDAGRPLLRREQVIPMIGGGAKHMLRQGMQATGGCEEAELTRLHRLLLDYYEAHIAVHSRPFPGAMVALDQLDAMGVTVAIVTNKLEGLALRLLDELDLTRRFACVIGGDTLGPGKSKPNRAPIDAMIERCGGGRAAFVGDSHFDIDAAKNAGIPNIACSFGFLMQPVAELGADAVIDHFDELIPTLVRLSA